jgi:hypothetical protein
VIPQCNNRRSRLLSKFRHPWPTRRIRLISRLTASVGPLLIRLVMKQARNSSRQVRDNANDALTKSPATRTIPVSAELIRLVADRLHTEYGDLDSDYVFS